MRLLVVAVSLAAAAWPRTIHALEPGSIGQTPVLLDVSESGSVFYNFDNRDSRPSQVATRVNDHFGLVYNRLSLQATAASASAGVRIDNVWFYTSPNATQVALEMAQEGEPPNDPDYFRSKLNEIGLELSNRYVNWLYPAKFYVTVSRPGLEATLGDASAQLGRGIVLSARKQDELGSDTTIRGARLTWRSQGSMQLKFTALGGELNPLRIDEPSGRYLGVASDGDVLHSVAEAGMPRAVETDFAALRDDCQTTPTCSYAPDRVLGGQIELAGKSWTLGSQGSVLLRQPALSEDLVRSSRRIVTLSQSVDFPRLTESLSAYTELAFQHLGETPGTQQIDPGYGLYLASSYTTPRATIVAEGRHYRRLFPLLANVKLSRAREFSSLAYNAVPTTEPADTDTEFEGMNTCVTGARVRGDFELQRGVHAVGSVSHYITYAESAPNQDCSTELSSLNRVYDGSSGFAFDSDDRSRHLALVWGGRLDRAERELISAAGSTSHLFYGETYLRHALELGLNDQLSVILTGRHRRRLQAEGGPGVPWYEGEEVLSVEWSEHSSVGLGAEYDSRPGVPGSYFNVELSHKPTPASRVALFAGQRRGAQRCVGGICRLYPPFEGIRLDVSTRF